MANLMELTGRTFLVTGASSGLGRACSILLSRLGARVILLARNAERLQMTLGKLEGSDHAICGFDLNDVAAIPGLVRELSETFAPLDGIVHSAGIAQTKPIQICRPEDFEETNRVNVVAASQLLRGLTCRGVIASAGCSVVLIGSVMSIVGAAGLAAYSTSKSALLGLVRSAAIELARYRIRVNAVLPGHFASEMAEAQRHRLTQDQVNRIEQMQPLGIGRPEDVAPAIAFLLADTGRWITGSSMVVDGGYSAH